MAETKNLCAQIDLALHTKVCEEREKAGQTTSQYITQLLMEYYEMKENGGKSSMENKGNRTMAFQISEELFQRIKRYLERESKHLGRKYTQREFVLDLITEALDAAEAVGEASGTRQEEGEALESTLAENTPVEAESEPESQGMMPTGQPPSDDERTKQEKLFRTSAQTGCPEQLLCVAANPAGLDRHLKCSI